MRRNHLLSCIFWCLIITFSCTTRKSDAPVVDFIYPSVNTVIDLSRDLNIEIDLSDDFMIMEYRFWLESGNGWEYFSEKKVVKSDNYKILYQFDLSESISSDFSIHIEVLDNDDNRTHEKIAIAIK